MTFSIRERIISIPIFSNLVNYVKKNEDFSNLLTIVEASMIPKVRKDTILQILERQGYSTVTELVETLHYSSATIYRDLNDLQKLHLVKRSYGGVELVQRNDLPIFSKRSDYQKLEKRQIGQRAAEKIQNGDTVFIAGTTTTEYIAPYLKGKSIRVLTNNMHLAAVLSEYGIEVICLGGRVIETPSILYSDETVETAMKYRADKFFFTVKAFSADGQIAASYYNLLYKVMMKNSNASYFLIDHSKLSDRIEHSMCDFSAVTCVISDYAFSPDVQKEFATTEFICTQR